MKLTEEQLRKAALQAQTLWLDTLPEKEALAEHTFSGRFEKKMQSLKRRSLHPVLYRVMQRAAMFFLICSLGFGTLLLSSPTARGAFIRWTVTWHEDHAEYRFFGPSHDLPSLPRYHISQLPEGYTQSDRIDMVGMTLIEYETENETDEPIRFRYSFMHEGTASFIETKNMIVFSVTVNGMEGHFYLSTDPAVTSAVIWMDTKNNLEFFLDAPLDKEGILHMAESVVLED